MARLGFLSILLSLQALIGTGFAAVSSSRLGVSFRAILASIDWLTYGVSFRY